jgi:hypothetical protein
MSPQVVTAMDRETKIHTTKKATGLECMMEQNKERNELYDSSRSSVDRRHAYKIKAR